MKKGILLLLLLVASIGSHAQLDGDGYYRVINNYTERYILVTDDKGNINLTDQTIDFHALVTMKLFSRVETDPASVIYIKEASAGKYSLQAQGTDTYKLTGAYMHIDLKNASAGTYWAYGQEAQAGVTVTRYLCDKDLTNKWGRVSQTDSGQVASNEIAEVQEGGQQRRFWRILPVNQNDGYYFGVAPALKVGNNYWQTFYAAFPFSFNGKS